MARKYYTLCIRENGKWAPQFGDYSKSVVKDEERDSYTRVLIENKVVRIAKKNRMIITTGETRVEIAHAIAKLNGE